MACSDGFIVWVIGGVISGAEGWEAIAELGKDQLD